MTEGKVYQFKDCELDLTRNCLLRNGREVHLRQKAFQVLVRLIECRGRLVTKDELFTDLWPDTAVTDDVLVQVVKELRRTLGDDPHHPTFIKTVPKSGYRFICEVDEKGSLLSYTEEITRVEFEIEEETRTEKLAVPSRSLVSYTSAGLRPRILIGAASILASVTVAVYLGVFSLRNAAEVRMPSIDGKTALAVMFFDNRSGDAELDWLREGLADMLITNLSRSHKVATLSRGQLQTLLERAGHKEGAPIQSSSAMEIARKAGVDTLVMGDFARIGEKIRVNATLLDAASGDLKAAESISVDSPEQILSEIDLLSLMLVKRLDSAGEDDTAKIASAMTDNLEAYRCYSLALEKAQGLNNTDAIELLEEAISLDPNFAMAHARLGHTYAVTWGLVEKARPYLARAFELSDRLTGKDRLYILAWYSIANLDYPGAITHFQRIIDEYPLETEAYLRLGNLLRGERKPAEAVSVLKRGLVIDPESPVLHNSLGLIYSERGNHNEAIAMHQKYVDLAPGEANAHDSLGMSYQWAGRYDEAIAAYSRSLQLNPKFEIAYAHISVAYFQTGRYEKALEYVNSYLETAPSDLEKGRAFSYLSRIHQARGEQQRALHFAKQALDSGRWYVGDLLSIKVAMNDRRAVSELRPKLLEMPMVSNRGLRVSERPTLYYQGLVALSESDTESALDLFRRSLQNSPYTWDIDSFEDCLGRAFLRLGRYSEAVSEYERILRLNPNYPLARFHLGEAYRAMGETNQAVENYRSFLEVWKDADQNIPEVAAARRYLQM